jgi:transcriptional regulator with XRE-family HTH domain
MSEQNRPGPKEREWDRRLGAQIEECRRRRRLHRREIAGIDLQRLGRLERGERSFRLAEMVRCAEALGVEIRVSGEGTALVAAEERS